MKMTTERKIYALILALAAGALMIDQVFLGGEATGPSEASATDVAAAESPGSEVKSTLAQAAAVLERVRRDAAARNEEAPTARRLATLAEQRGLDPLASADAFRPAESWIPSPPTAPGEASEPDAAEEFIDNHRLLAVLTTGRGGMAVLAGRPEPITIGQTLDGFTLVSVTGRTAVFESGRTRATLELQRPAE